MRRLSPVGAVCCLPYAGFIAYCQWAAHMPGINSESLLIYRQLPVFLLMPVIGWFDLTLPDWLPWMAVSIATMALTFAIFYWLGSWLEKDYRRGQAYRRSVSAKREDGQEQWAHLMPRRARVAVWAVPISCSGACDRQWIWGGGMPRPLRRRPCGAASFAVPQ